MKVGLYSFSKKIRLRYSHEFSYTFSKYSYKLVTQAIIIYSKKNTLNHPRIGIIVSKKNVKYAHIRNDIKRHIRESFRMYQHSSQKMDFIIIIQKNIVYIHKSVLKQILKKIWQHDNNHTNLKILNNTINTYIPNIH